MEASKRKILLVDDAPLVLDSIAKLLEEHGFLVTAVGNAGLALNRISEEHFDLILTDNQMPGMTGLELIGRIHAMNLHLPIILMTAYSDTKTAVEAFKQGVFDFVIKPFQAAYLLNTVKKAVEYSMLLEVERKYKLLAENTLQAKPVELITFSREIIVAMASAAEYRIVESGGHIFRIGQYTAKIASAMGLPYKLVEDLTWASLLHDIGKISVPDAIILKPGPLTPEEFVKMKQHTVMGHKILHHSSQPLMKLAASIALNHHERWDGSGYPYGLRGEDIPLEATIVLLADQYDSMRNSTTYKSGLSHEQVLKVIIEGDGRTLPSHFNPTVYRAFIKVASTFEAIYDGIALPEAELVIQRTVKVPGDARRTATSEHLQLDMTELGKIHSLN